MNVIEAISRSEELHVRLTTLNTIIFMCDRDQQGMQGYSSVLQRIKEETQQEADDIKSKLEKIEFK